MEKNPTLEKSESDGESEHKQYVEDPSSIPDSSLSQVLEEVDRFIETLSSNPSEVPNFVESLSKMVESMMTKYELKSKFGQNQEDDSLFIESVHVISRLLNKVGEFPSNSTPSPSINRASCVLHQAMSFLEDAFRTLLENSKNKISDQKTPRTPKQSSFNSPHDSVVTDSESYGEEEFPAFSPESISAMNRIATAMISAGYETECSIVYGILRRNAFRNELNNLGFDNISIDDVQRMQWESLEGEITMWTNVVKHCSTILFSKERKLCDSVFSDFPAISQRLFGDLAGAVVIRFLNFAEAVVLTKRSAEKLFKFLDMYETLRDLIPALDDSNSEKSLEELISETGVAKSRIGEAAANIFSDLENSIKSDSSRIPVPSGAVHPLTRYTMNYLKYACEYSDTLEQVFQQIKKFEKSNESTFSNAENCREIEYDDQTPKTSPFSIQLMRVMDLLDANLDMKSNLYRDPALMYIFLMNNGRYIYQKIKGSTELHEIMGANWCRKRSADLRQYHKNYQRETWRRLLQCMNHEGLQVSGKISKPVLKERFKSFNQMFEEIHKTQSTWVVSDEQLQSELRVSISAVVIPAYRSFLGRFKQYIESGRQPERYIKYQPEDIETLIEELFDGNATSMARRRT